MSQPSHTGSAASYCDNLNVGGYSDWFLPSGAEISLMYTNLHASGVGGFCVSGYMCDWYWSSSESSAEYGTLLRFGVGDLIGQPKGYNLGVRCARAF
jgi:hypothetical protein